MKPNPILIGTFIAGLILGALLTFAFTSGSEEDSEDNIAGSLAKAPAAGSAAIVGQGVDGSERDAVQPAILDSSAKLSANNIMDDYSATNAVLPLVNELRCSLGLHPLVAHPQLIAAAARHSANMVNANFFDHKGSDGSDPGSRVDDTGYWWSSVSENIAWGQDSVQSVFEAWKNSPGHYANMIKARTEHIGLALNTDSNGSIYWTMVLGDDDGDKTNADPSAPSC